MTLAPPILRTVHVRRTPDEAFRVFTDEIASWWPLATHAVTEQPVSVAFTDGRIVETSEVGETCDWGEVTVWEPPHRLAFTWRVGLALDQTPTLLEVSFSGDEDGTRVELTHSGWEAYGERAAQVHARYGAPTGWTGVLDAYARQAAAQASVQ